MKTLDRNDVVRLIEKERNGQSLRAFGESVSLSAAYLSDVLRGNREPGPRLLKILKLRKIKTTTTIYERIT